MEALVIHPHGEVTEIDNSLEAWQEAVGGNVEALYVPKAISFLVNETGKFDQKANPANPYAMKVHSAFGGELFAGDWIAGNMVVVGDADDKGNTLPLDAETAAEVRRLVGLQADAGLFVEVR